MKELWTANQFHLMNRPFTEMGYNSSGLNIVPERLLLATRRPSMHHPLASGEPSFDPLRTTRRRATNHATHGTTSGDPPPASHLPSFCVASGGPLHSIRHLAASHLPASSPRDTRQPIASHLPSFCTTFGDPLQAIRHLAANHPPSHGTASADPRASPADTLQTSAGTNRCP